MISVNCPAKLNLRLRVLGNRPDGFHQLTGIMVPLDWCDVLEVDVFNGTGEINLTVSSERETVPVGPRNLAHRAVTAFMQAAGVRTDVNIHLIKSIPIGSGLGGGSSDAAGVLMALNELSGDPLSEEDLHRIALELGSDCPFFLDPWPAIVEGRGDIVRRIPDFGELHVVVAVPDLRLSTARVFQEFDRARDGHSNWSLGVRDRIPLLEDWNSNDLTGNGDGDIHACLFGRGPFNKIDLVPAEWVLNDLSAAVFHLCPRSGFLVKALTEAGAWATGVTGSGSGVFGLFDSAEDASEVAAGIRQMALPGEEILALRAGGIDVNP